MKLVHAREIDTRALIESMLRLTVFEWIRYTDKNLDPFTHMYWCQNDSDGPVEISFADSEFEANPPEKWADLIDARISDAIYYKAMRGEQ